ncbi:SGNH/GDSL hydrolase family protein [Polaribacter atrinae]|uniref:SGNH/GDSL hydrolase family protein n=1 Tax=Polaribacter atrinae TaxID=1333662 RepID=UPI002493CD56|nr:SGNH/GDSL hydrolase family protein [Polaribacter atrinae]
MIFKKKYFFAVLIIGFFIISAFSIKKPKILIIGDSISIGYTPFVKKHFFDKATVFHNAGNAQHTGTGLKKIEEWLGDKHWDIIQFNWGLWDLCYRHPDSKEYGKRDKIHGKPEFTIDEYASNLDSLVAIIKKKSNAKLIFVTTTYVPKDETGRYESDVEKYNDAAKLVMKKHNISVNDIYEQSISIHNRYGNGSKDVHYTTNGYNKLSELIIEFIETEIKS